MRLADPDQHTEAITSRPLLLYAVGRQTRHANQTSITITSTHGKAGRVRRMLAEVAAFFTSLRPMADKSGGRVWFCRFGQEPQQKGKQSTAPDERVCSYLSLALLAGVGLHAAFGWWWADAVGALATLPVILWQGWETLGEVREKTEGASPLYASRCISVF